MFFVLAKVDPPKPRGGHGVRRELVRSHIDLQRLSIEDAHDLARVDRVMLRVAGQCEGDKGGKQNNTHI